MTMARRIGALLPGAALLLGLMAGDASAETQAYRAKMHCEEGGGAAEINTFVRCAPGTPRFCEPFFKVLVTLADLPSLPVETCAVTLACEGATEITFDCALDHRRQSLGFNSGNLFLGVLSSGACAEPSVRVAITYTGASRICTPGF